MRTGWDQGPEQRSPKGDPHPAQPPSWDWLSVRPSATGLRGGGRLCSPGRLGGEAGFRQRAPRLSPRGRPAGPGRRHGGSARPINNPEGAALRQRGRRRPASRGPWPLTPGLSGGTLGAYSAACGAGVPLAAGGNVGGNSFAETRSL